MVTLMNQKWSLIYTLAEALISEADVMYENRIDSSKSLQTPFVSGGGGGGIDNAVCVQCTGLMIWCLRCGPSESLIQSP